MFSEYALNIFVSATAITNAKNNPAITHKLIGFGCKDKPNAFTQCKRIDFFQFKAKFSWEPHTGTGTL